MKIAIIGAGFTGLAASYSLLKKGHEVTIFEKDSQPGGLALGFKTKEWDWTLERHYHHWFTNNAHIINLAKKLGVEVITRKPKTSVYVDSKIYEMDSVMNVLRFPKLSFMERIRMGTVLGLLRFNPFWQPLEYLNASKALPFLMGKKSYETLWEPLLKAKFGEYSNQISLAWYWGRISERTRNLAYPKGGFLAFSNFVALSVQKLGGKILYRQEVLEINDDNRKVSLTLKSGKTKRKIFFDKAVVTLPSSFFIALAPSLPQAYKENLSRLKGVGAVNMVVRLKKPFLKDNTYWLNICQKAPVLAIVEHTNFMDKKYYNNEHIVYFGNYLSVSHPFFKMDSAELLNTYHPFLKQINPTYRKEIIEVYLFKTPFAQPIIPLRYSKMLPSFQTPMKNVYLANMQQVYPWDRGTSHAVDLGERIAEIIHK